jgi:hypothetical protein
MSVTYLISVYQWQWGSGRFLKAGTRLVIISCWITCIVMHLNADVYLLNLYTILNVRIVCLTLLVGENWNLNKSLKKLNSSVGGSLITRPVM